MFNLEIEKKILGFVKKSPLGVTSSEIASYVGLNRMTITKYLAIIKERALIDFKQFGMAKLWYIPVNITKESFFSKIMENIAVKIPERDLKSLSEGVGVKLGEDINQMYLNFYGVHKLNLDQITEAYEDIGKKLGGIFKARLANEKISVDIVKSPFEENNAAIINRILSAVFVKIASLNLGYSKAILSEHKGHNVAIEVYLKK
jgi:hypothetical protein|tara:strand:+ start:3253 stop:3861 length:609 start_codon:yes stop_codon:yes gene_type:complete